MNFCNSLFMLMSAELCKRIYSNDLLFDYLFILLLYLTGFHMLDMSDIYLILFDFLIK